MELRSPAVSASRLRSSLLSGPKLRKWAWTLVIFAILTLLVIAPIVGLLNTSLRALDGSFTLDNFATLGSARARDAIWNTVVVSTGATIGSILIGGLLAWLVERTDVPGKGFVQIAAVVPIFFSALVGVLSWSMLGSPQSGYLNAVLTSLGLPSLINVNSMVGIIFVLTLYHAPFAFLLIRSALSIASGDLENAARMSGASAFQATTRITIPLVSPAVIGAAILVFVIASANFEVPQILGSFARLDFLPGYVFRLVNSTERQIGAAAAVGVAILCVTWIAIWVESRYVLRRAYASAGGKGTQTLVVRLGPWRWVGFAFALIYIVLAAVLPTIALVIGAFRPSIYHSGLADLLDPGTYTTMRFAESLLHPKFQTGLSNSVILAIITTLVGVTLTFVVAYVARRKSVHGSSMIEYISLAPVAIPGLILGLAFLAQWLRSPIPLYGTLTILVIAFISQLFPFSFVNLSGTLVKLDPEVEDSAVMSGAARWRAIVSITVPIIRVALGSAALLLFVLSFRQFTAALFLYTPRTIPLSVVIYEQWDSGAIARMASMALAFTAVLVVAAAINYFVSRPRPEEADRAENAK